MSPGDSQESSPIPQFKSINSLVLNQIPYDYTVEVRNRFKGLDLIEKKETTSQRSYTNQLIPNGGSCLVKAMVFPVVMYGCESWTIKKAELRRIDAFELWCWRRLLRVPWTARGSNQSNPKGDQPWVFFGRNDAKAETPVLWPPHVKS